uniref:RNA helicase n=1 Tax=Euglena gracilis TaxID=3039 RepID=A0AA51YH54_EUGGR|nr:ATP-dependent RNA helicase DHX8 [Euglena gracilis]BDX17153.1 ATP-dependent RNA helicase PRP22C [Euglena gracilis]
MRFQYAADLPITSARAKILDMVRRHPVVVLVGETGSGKTTQVPQYLAQELLGAAGSSGRPPVIGVTQPRRVAAITVAKRVAQECGVELGQEVGYAVRFDDQTSTKTIIKYMTDGILLREILTDTTLSKYAYIVLDEAHERTLHGDVLFGLLKQLRQRRPTLKVIVMSATLDAESFSRFWDNAPMGYVAGRQFPVTVFYTVEPQLDYVDAAITTVLQLHLQEGPLQGDMLVFLTGQEEIDDAKKILEERSRRLSATAMKLKVVPLYAALPPDKQMLAFAPAPPGCRKVILSTNIAETSVTINGIRYVIDTGMVKAREYNPNTGLDALRAVPVSRAQARQRAGRAGREAAGKCFRLYTEDSFDTFAQHTTPEIQRVNLSSVVLHLKHLEVHDILQFPFMDPPSKDALVQSLETLLALGAVDADLRITPLGTAMALFPLDPMHAKALINSFLPPFRCGRAMAVIIAMLSVENVFFTPKSEQETADAKRRIFASPYGDQLTLLNVYKAYQKAKKRRGQKEWAQEHYINLRSMASVDDVLGQLLELEPAARAIMQKDAGAGAAAANPTALAGVELDSEDLQVRKCLTSACFLNAAVWSPGDRCYRTAVGRNTVHVHPGSVLFQSQKPNCVIYNSVVHTTQRFMRFVLEVEERWVLEYGRYVYRAPDSQPKKKRPATTAEGSSFLGGVKRARGEAPP